MIKPPFYVISDTHFFHDNIVKYSGRYEQFGSLLGLHDSTRLPDLPLSIQRERVDEYMVQRWNKTIGPDDVVLHLGDVAMASRKPPHKRWERFQYEIAPRLNGDKYLILGNHDPQEDEVDWEGVGFKVIEPFSMLLPGKGEPFVTFDHYPLPHYANAYPNELVIHGHIHNNGYPIADDWREGTTETRKRHINVSVEAIDYTPQDLETLISRYELP